MNYKRLYIQNALIFITVVTKNRKPIKDTDNVKVKYSFPPDRDSAANIHWTDRK